MLKIKSINAACYISYVTGIQAEIVTDEGMNNFHFPRVAEVMNAYDNYRKAVALNRQDGNQGELMVNFITTNKYVRIYKRKHI